MPGAASPGMPCRPAGGARNGGTTWRHKPAPGFLPAHAGALPSPGGGHPVQHPVPGEVVQPAVALHGGSRGVGLGRRPPPAARPVPQVGLRCALLAARAGKPGAEWVLLSTRVSLAGPRHAPAHTFHAARLRLQPALSQIAAHPPACPGAAAPCTTTSWIGTRWCGGAPRSRWGGYAGLAVQAWPGVLADRGHALPPGTTPFCCSKCCLQAHACRPRLAAEQPALKAAQAR